jgi:hypothetical protein
MNEHILFVIDHLENPDKYTQEELEANHESSYDAYLTRLEEAIH